MTEPAAITGDLSDYKYVKTRKVFQVVVEVPIEQAVQVQNTLGALDPGGNVPVVIARLVVPPEGQPAPKRELTEGEKAVQLAGILCGEPEFQEWIAHSKLYGGTLILENDDMALDVTQNGAARYVRRACGVGSRSEIKVYSGALTEWNRLVADYRAHQQYGEGQ